MLEPGVAELTPPTRPSAPVFAANTQSKGGEKKAVGGGGSAGMAARLGGTAEVRRGRRWASL